MAQRTTPPKATEAARDAQRVAKPPLHPYWVMLIAVLLPGVGQLLNNTPKRAIMFIFFMMMFGWVTLHLAPPQASFVGRYAGGFFIYAISIMDAYRWARYRWAFFQQGQARSDETAR